MVDVKVDTEDIEKKPEAFFTQFDAVSLLVLSLVGELSVGSHCDPSAWGQRQGGLLQA